ncbi:phage holin family protein [Lachnotalea glycerini]|uniref:Holin n=1 Tax=Lachnotalea glycerini TaxID=1763509 RepID=A0A371JCK6_9FIRM|nr:phage holin family protein [Lachnotalea glycerini]RDY30418.1 holin [Lachnotalea glycerini]
MEKINQVKVMFITLLGGTGSFLVQLLGGWTTDLNTLLIFMGVDFITGLMIAAIWKKSGKSESGALNSISAWKGLCRKGASLLVVLISYRLDVTLHVDYIKTAVIIAFIANEGISIVENLGVMGVPLPTVITKAIDVLKEKSTEGE